LFEKIKSYFRAFSSDKKSFLALVGGTTFAQAINFLCSPIQTRLFSPEVFGELSVFTSITGIVGVVICLRYELAIVLPKEDDEGFALLRLSWMFALIIAAVTGIVFGFGGTQIYARFNAPSLVKYWGFVPIALFLTGIIISSNYWFTRKGQFTVLSYNKVLPVLAVNLVSIGLGFAGNRALGARLVSTLVGNLVNICVIAFALMPEIKRRNEKKEYKKIDLIKKYKNFLVYDVWGSLINNLSWMIVPILMNYYYSSNAAGQYAIGMRVIQLPFSVIGASIDQVFLKNASQKKYDGTLYEYSVSIVKKLLLYTVPLTLVIFLFGKTIFTTVFGSGWGLAGTYSKILAPWALIWFCASPMHSVFALTGKQHLYLLFSILNLVAHFLSLYLGNLFQRNDILGIFLFSASGFVVYGLSLFLAFYAAKSSDKKYSVIE